VGRRLQPAKGSLVKDKLTQSLRITVYKYQHIKITFVMPHLNAGVSEVLCNLGDN